jgi:hypothetical protein
MTKKGKYKKGRGGLGSVMYERTLVDYTPHHVYMTSSEHRERASAIGVEAVWTGKLLSIRPVMSKGDYDGLKFSSRPAATGHEDLLYPFVVPGTQVWNRYMSTRKIVERIEESGRKVATITSNMYEKLQDFDDATLVKKVFRLTQVLTDTNAQRKFSLTHETLRALKAMAIARPDDAARQAMKLMRAARPDLEVIVTAEGYSRSRRAAKDTIAEFCSRFARVSATDEATIIGNDLFMYGPGNAKDDWHVSGPLLHGPEVALIHRAVESCGGSAVMFALGSELVTLRIDIALRDKYLCPDVEYHVGDMFSELPSGSSPTTTSLLSSEGRSRVKGLRAAVAEVTESGKLVASCVRVSDKYYIVGNHVLQGTGLMVDGQPLRALRTVAPDLWLVEAVGPSAPVWALRDAREGERVMVCYRGPSGELQYTSPMSVLSVGPLALTLSTTAELCKGMSGGAVVALDDLALLGIYEGTGRQQALALVFSPTMFADVHSISGQTVESRMDGMGVLQKLRDRGLGPMVDAALAAVQPLYAGVRHVGHAFGVGSKCFTTCNPDAAALLLEPGGQPLLFSAQGFLYVADVRLPQVPVVVRKPNYFEKVVVIGRDMEGPYYSSVSRVVHVGVGSSNFSLESLDGETDLPFDGGLVMSLVDGAVLGTHVKQSVSAGYGAVEFCVAMPKEQVDSGSDKSKWIEALRAAFPMLRPSLWSGGVLEEVFKHESVQVYQTPGKVFNSGCAPLAFIGASCLSTRFGQLARQFGLPFYKWDKEVSDTLSSSALSELAVKLDLERLVQYGSECDRSQLGAESKASVVRAVVGAAKTCELESVFEEFLDLVLYSLGSSVVAPLRSPQVERANLVG